ncbi:MAG: tetratricopeptide repeat protein [Candidatus Sumerlaeota bacterium]|nr:tetratricopeptide repeat protein [Candidatus Sumerlaeota bacterium]
MKPLKAFCAAGAFQQVAPALRVFILAPLAAGVLAVLSACVILPDEARQMVTDVRETRFGVRDLKLRVDDSHKDLRTRQLSIAEQDQSQYNQLRDRMVEIERRLERIEASLSAIETAMIESRGAGVSKGGAPATSARAMSVTTGGVALYAKDMMRTAMELAEKSRYEEAIPVYQNVVQSFPSSDAAGDALFGIGECLENLKQYPAAIEAFLKVPAQYPDSAKVPVARYHAAMCAMTSDDKKRAIALLEEIIVKHPSFEGLSRVKQTLKELQSKP